jgi:GNAT superfamily N-acetyltransferase
MSFVSARRATAADLGVLTDTITGAFLEDPVWGWAFGPIETRLERSSAVWNLLLAGALRYPWVWVTPVGEATAVWIPPGGTELSDEGEAALDALIETGLGVEGQRVAEMLRRCEEVHPDLPSHYYLTLLGTHPAHRGQRLGWHLLAESLACIDDEGMPAYLESTNPANTPHYEALGFKVVQETPAGPGGPVMSTMWREPR